MRLPTCVAELAAEETTAGTSTFSLWLIPGRQAMLHDGRTIRLRVESGGHPIELTIPPELADNHPFSFRVAPGAFQRPNWHAARRANEVLTRSTPTAAMSTALRPSRTAVAHMRLIQTLDARIAGASHRDIAAAIFGDDSVDQRWSADSELRAQVRYLVRRSSELASNGYRQLAGLNDHPGEFDGASVSP